MVVFDYVVFWFVGNVYVEIIGIDECIVLFGKLGNY